MDTLNPRDLQTITAVVGTVIALITLVAMLVYQARRVSAAMRTLEAQQAAHAAAGIFQIVSSEYLDRQFTSTEPPDVDGKRVERMRDLKGRGQRLRRSNNDAWTEASTNGEKRGWENRLAYELSIALERIGIAVFTGVVPARFFLALAADQVIDDWMLCQNWITKYRESESVKDPKFGVYYHRRHAEWLFLLCVLWMAKNFPNYPPLAEACRNRTKLEDEFLKLRRLETSLMPEWVWLQILEILDFKTSKLLEILGFKTSKLR